ncbi:hypothetical protein HIM_11964 [Hirsutella minnesotensis 3608]|uniref:Uncharacterized protein n=1 Tax=Hirsutella minnesotensis 3608 TaxID=1043627 RepID=A0A0F7ZIK2_9HYPO|nr:hypothetical protein HIM_11964 [Hirsutella minnesotensis 3608]
MNLDRTASPVVWASRLFNHGPFQLLDQETRRRPIRRAGLSRNSRRTPPIQGARLGKHGGSRSSENPQPVSTRKASQSQLAPLAKPFFLGIRDNDGHTSAPAQDPAERQPRSPDSRPRDGIKRSRPSPVSKSGPGTRGQTIETDSRPLAPLKPSSAAYSIAGVPAVPTRSSRHVDLLEAQSGIKPYDFKSRVLAAGTRDYGEDVADRNLGQNVADMRPV